MVSTKLGVYFFYCNLHELIASVVFASAATQAAFAHVYLFIVFQYSTKYWIAKLKAGCTCAEMFEEYNYVLHTVALIAIK